MGVIRSLARIDPKVWDRASKRVEALGTDLLNRRVAIEFLSELGKTPSEDSVVSMIDDNDGEADPSLLNALFEEGVTEEAWYLDKSLDGLGGVARLLPGGDALKRIIEFEGIDIEPPDGARPMDFGLFGCCSSASLADCASVARRFALPSDVISALHQWSPGFVDRLLGRGMLATKALDTMASEYYADHWQTLCRAILVTTSRGDYLGLAMSG